MDAKKSYEWVIRIDNKCIWSLTLPIIGFPEYCKKI